MGVVVPGNKQIGSFGFNLLQSSSRCVTVNSATGFAVAKSDGVFTPIVPYNVNFGSYSVSLLVSSKNTINISSAVGLAVVKYTPPTQFYINSATGFAVVKDSTTATTVPAVQNIGLGSLGINGLVSGKKTLLVQSVVGLALVQYFNQRNENVYHPTNYGLNNTVV